ncbi:DUF6152 family protein [Mastigocladopsis repens]|uniref:DUF6152 family protein n=1 Tax=Mastigocladopsis repens TaxID=221287 RepID=UPI0002FF1F3E|nr:DUF6152 family protein [Mastigocladopsis repens]
MDNQQQVNKAMVKKGFVQAALTAATIATFLASGTENASAHHGWSEYNNEQTLNLSGEIQNISYGNPHTTIEVKTDDNKVWQAVLAPPARMQRRGLAQGALQVGQRVRLVGYPHRSDTNEMRAERITIGKQTVELR